MKKTVIILSLFAFIASSCKVLKNTATNDKGVVINGVRWATRNVDKPGTFVKKPEDAGMFYQWNRKKAWSATEKASDWDGKIISENYACWEKANDPSPAGWRIPTFKEIKTLLDDKKVSSEWTTINGVDGKKFTDKATGNSIFLPAAGHLSYVDGSFHSAGWYGCYWSSTPHDNRWAYSFYFDYIMTWDHNFRTFGRSVRVVAE